MSGFIEALSTFFRRSADETRGEVLQGACPNCWGHYEYDGEVRDVMRGGQIDIENNRAYDAFIRDFVDKHVDGVNTKSGSRACPRCGRSFSS